MQYPQDWLFEEPGLEGFFSSIKERITKRRIANMTPNERRADLIRQNWSDEKILDIFMKSISTNQFYEKGSRGKLICEVTLKQLEPYRRSRWGIDHALRQAHGTFYLYETVKEKGTNVFYNVYLPLVVGESSNIAPEYQVDAFSKDQIINMIAQDEHVDPAQEGAIGDKIFDAVYGAGQKIFAKQIAKDEARTKQLKEVANKKLHDEIMTSPLMQRDPQQIFTDFVKIEGDFLKKDRVLTGSKARAACKDESAEEFYLKPKILHSGEFYAICEGGREFDGFVLFYETEDSDEFPDWGWEVVSLKDIYETLTKK